MASRAMVPSVAPARLVRHIQRHPYPDHSSFTFDSHPPRDATPVPPLERLRLVVSEPLGGRHGNRTTYGEECGASYPPARGSSCRMHTTLHRWLHGDACESCSRRVAASRVGDGRGCNTDERVSDAIRSIIHLDPTPRRSTPRGDRPLASQRIRQRSCGGGRGTRTTSSSARCHDNSPAAASSAPPSPSSRAQRRTARER